MLAFFRWYHLRMHDEARIWKAKADRANARIDMLHETLANQMNEIEMMQAEAVERESAYDALSLNADALAKEIIKVMESRRPFAEATAMLYNAIAEHMRTRNPGVSETATGTVYHTEEADAHLYEIQAAVKKSLNGIEGLQWEKSTSS